MYIDCFNGTLKALIRYHGSTNEMLLHERIKPVKRKAGDKEKHRKAARDQSSIKRIYIEVTKGRAVLRRPVATRASCIIAL